MATCTGSLTWLTVFYKVFLFHCYLKVVTLSKPLIWSENTDTEQCRCQRSGSRVGSNLNEGGHGARSGFQLFRMTRHGIVAYQLCWPVLNKLYHYASQRIVLYIKSDSFSKYFNVLHIKAWNVDMGLGRGSTGGLFSLDFEIWHFPFKFLAEKVVFFVSSG